jgi:hypothetical protein
MTSGLWCKGWRVSSGSQGTETGSRTARRTWHSAKTHDYSFERGVPGRPLRCPVAHDVAIWPDRSMARALPEPAGRARRKRPPPSASRLSQLRSIEPPPVHDTGAGNENRQACRIAMSKHSVLSRTQRARPAADVLVLSDTGQAGLRERLCPHRLNGAGCGAPSRSPPATMMSSEGCSDSSVVRPLRVSSVIQDLGPTFVRDPDRSRGLEPRQPLGPWAGNACEPLR